MLKSSLLELINSFSAKELKEFGEYIRSPFFNKSKTLVSFYSIIKSSLKSKDPALLEKQYVFKKLFKGKEYNDAVMRNLMLNLSKLAENYLVHLHTERYEHGWYKHLLGELRERNLVKNFNKNLNQFNELLDKAGFQYAEYFYYKFVAAGERDLLNSRGHRRLNIKDLPGESLFDLSDNMFLYFMCNIMSRYRHLLGKGLIKCEDIKFEFLQHAINGFSERVGRYKPVLGMFYDILKLQCGQKDEDYFKAKKFLLENPQSIPKEELFNMVNTLQNFCNDRYHTGSPDFLKEILALEKFLIAEDAVVVWKNMYLQPVRYRRTVLIALKVKEYEWAEKYMEEFRETLPPEHRESAYNYSRSRVEFEKGNYNNSLEWLSKVPNADITYKLEIKSSLLKIYYELEMINEAIHHSNTFKQFLANNKLLRKNEIATASNFIKLTGKLIRVKDLNDYGEACVLFNEIKNTGVLIGKDWLIRKVEELKKRAAKN